jgi:hypothetical protein
VEAHRFGDCGPQKQRTIELARYDGILNLYADEIVSPGIREIIG